MTPEREDYERQLAFTQRGVDGASRELAALIRGAEEWDLVLRIDVHSHQPPEMGEVFMVPDVRITRKRQRELEALRLAAEKSEGKS